MPTDVFARLTIPTIQNNKATKAQELVTEPSTSIKFKGLNATVVMIGGVLFVFLEPTFCCPKIEKFDGYRNMIEQCGA